MCHAAPHALPQVYQHLGQPGMSACCSLYTDVSVAGKSVHEHMHPESDPGIAGCAVAGVGLGPVLCCGQKSRHTMAREGGKLLQSNGYQRASQCNACTFIFWRN